METINYLLLLRQNVYKTSQMIGQDREYSKRKIIEASNRIRMFLIGDILVTGIVKNRG